ncbi:ATP-grasp domain-containing protein [Campylobacter lanienae]|uniref:ATP-grasp domain-containing protein n=1 Tax=Campylobacter lanienae TaxID=75658 RepID=UPI000BB42764|nr:ATP-grasp domain-containing protein [Campylobacter lanienae]
MYNILVTGVGAIIGYGIINSLKKSKFNVNIIGIDIYADAYGQHLCDKFVQAILASDEKYPEFIKNLIDTYNIDLVLFGTEQEIIRLMEAKEEMGEYYSKLVINKEEIVKLSQDKWLTNEFLNKNNLLTIPTKINGDFKEIVNEFGLPFLLKPRRSYASKGIEKIYNEEDFNYYRKKSGDQFMVQKIIGDNDHEYTSAIFGFGDGNFVSPITLKRKLSGEGATAKAEVIEIDEINELIKKYCEILKPFGPTNFQFRKDKDRFYLLEINPRISSSTSLREYFGYNEAEMCIDFFVNKIKPKTNIIKKGYAVRYIADCIIYI